jgi:hypothetical protein
MLRTSGLLGKLNGKDQYINKGAQERLQQIKFWKKMKQINSENAPGTGPVSLHATAYRGQILDPKEPRKSNAGFIGSVIKNIVIKTEQDQGDITPPPSWRGGRANVDTGKKVDVVNWDEI